jgi:hypothetical protein
MPSPVAVRNPVFWLRDGSLVLPVYSFRRPETSYLMESGNGGLTWRLRGVIARPAAGMGFNETFLHECPSGKLVALMRSNPAGYLYTAVSIDGGRKWSTPRREDVRGYPFCTLTMPSGRVLVAYGYRWNPFGVRARLADAELNHIAGAEELVLRDDGHGSDLGYPQAVLMRDGSAMVAYYFNSKADGGTQRYIAATWVREI